MALDTCTAYFLGTVGYRLAWEIQNNIADQIKKNSRSNTILLLQHPSVYTIGRRGSRADIFLSDQELKNLDIDLIENRPRRGSHLPRARTNDRLSYN